MRTCWKMCDIPWEVIKDVIKGREDENKNGREEKNRVESSVKAGDQYNLGYLICIFYALCTAVTDKNVRGTVLLWGMSAVWIEAVWILTMDKALYNNKKSFG